jgi:hypothetical protein
MTGDTGTRALPRNVSATSRRYAVSTMDLELP